MKAKEIRKMLQDINIDSIQVITKEGICILLSTEEVEYNITENPGMIDFGDQYHVTNTIMLEPISEAKILVEPNKKLTLVLKIE